MSAFGPTYGAFALAFNNGGIGSNCQLTVSTTRSDNVLYSTNVTAAQAVDNTWHHLCVERYQGYLRCYIDGVGGNSVLASGQVNTAPMLFGWGLAGSGDQYKFTGNMDEVRFCQQAVYKGNFVPPVSAFPNA